MILKVSDSSTAVNEIASVNIVIEQAPNGISGFDLEVAIADGDVARINDVVYPPELAFTTRNDDLLNLPDKVARLFAADTSEKIQQGLAVEITIAVLKVEGLTDGTTSIAISLSTLGIDDDFGSSIQPQLFDGTFVVVGD